MEVFKLDSSYKPSTSIPLKPGDSLAWTERYRDAGEFQLEVLNDIRVLSTLPLGTLISHTDTLETMIVENHEIVRDKDKQIKVTVTGRSFETFGENRPTLGSASALYDGAEEAITELITAGAEEVVKQLYEGRLKPGVASADDAVANLNVVKVLRDPDSSFTHPIQRGDIYNRSLEFLKISSTGIKTERPTTGSTIDIVIHDGLDLTDEVVFYAQTEDLTDAQYFWSIRAYRNYAQIAAHSHARLYRSRDVGSTQQGLNRRIIYVAANDIEGAFGSPTSTDAVAARAQNVLDSQPMISLLQARVSPTAKPKFKIDYNVGDLVLVFGEFSEAQVMRVTEHILTVDDAGISGYPSLSAV